ncbi:Integrin beta-3 [Thelohanellus kitauei]|uniref:Integrin beta-3 n=1 Tax=Thelohanellus kitauei TaxID=669202 RepID=A0A0C2J1T0_THEKT|nr:Integrin beta-3 [Thelohanellus kitauei]
MYVFKNLQSMTIDRELIKVHLLNDDTRPSDDAEAVLDAMIQVSECSDKIGWEQGNDVMRLMIVVTQSKSKLAGPGNIIAFYNPHDGKCKMGNSQVLKTMDWVLIENNSGLYTPSSIRGIALKKQHSGFDSYASRQSKTLSGKCVFDFLSYEKYLYNYIYLISIYLALLSAIGGYFRFKN